MRLKVTFQNFLFEKSRKIPVWREKTPVRHTIKLTCKCSIGKLWEFYTNYVNFGLGSLWNFNFWKKRARIYMTKGTKCTFDG